MKSFKTIVEEQQKKLTMLFGRMNPPTKGHEENVEGFLNYALEWGVPVGIGYGIGDFSS